MSLSVGVPTNTSRDRIVFMIVGTAVLTNVMRMQVESTKFVQIMRKGEKKRMQVEKNVFVAS